jgi:hypothetical protein
MFLAKHYAISMGYFTTRNLAVFYLVTELNPHKPYNLLATSFR